MRDMPTVRMPENTMFSNRDENMSYNDFLYELFNKLCIYNTAMVIIRLISDITISDSTIQVLIRAITRLKQELENLSTRKRIDFEAYMKRQISSLNA
jgi:hypothetical protein